MKHLDEFSATATTEVDVPGLHPEVLALHEQHPHATLEQVQYWWMRFAGNLRKTANILELGKTNGARIMMPGAHSALAKDRPQGGASESWMDTLNMEAASAENAAARRFETNVPRTEPRRAVSIALAQTRQRLGTKMHLLGDTSRLFALVGDTEDMMANNS